MRFSAEADPPQNPRLQAKIVIKIGFNIDIFIVLLLIIFIVLLLGMCSIEGAEEATGTIAAETRELEAIEAVINGGHGTSMRPFVN